MTDELPPTVVGPWRRRTRTVAYENPWIEVRHDEVDRPDGSPGIYGVVHFRNAAVGVVAVDDEGRILFVGQHRYPLDAYSWEIPEGGAPIDEDPLDGARRELAEETGFEAATWSELARFSLSNSITDERAQQRRGRQQVQDHQQPERAEQRSRQPLQGRERFAAAGGGRHRGIV